MKLSNQFRNIIKKEITKLENGTFLIKIHGDSMVNANINDGDTVLVKESKEFVSGEIVLAYKNRKAMIKRFISDDKPPFVYLRPENPKYENIVFTEDVRLKGKVISVLKNNYS